jgi:hypothetical protein
MTKPWVPHGPEERLSVIFNQFLEHALVPPFYATAIHDSDHGGRTDSQRARDRERGIKPGQLDWEVWQGPPDSAIARRVELKRGRNETTDNQNVTIRKLTECGFPPIVGRELRQLVIGMVEQGFRFQGNLETLVQHYEAKLAGMDREAEMIKAGTVVKKVGPARPRQGKTRGKAAMSWVRP